MIRLLIIAAALLTHGGAQAEEPPPAAVAPGGPEITIEEFLQKLSTVPDVVSRKDPFIQAPPPFEIPKSLDNGINMSAPVLERYPVNQYGVVATLLGDQYPRALLKLPSAERGKVLIVKEKDRLGNRSGVITKITRDGLVVLQTQRSPLGFVDKTEVVLRVGVMPGGPGGGGPPPPVQQPVMGQPAPGGMPNGMVPNFGP